MLPYRSEQVVAAVVVALLLQTGCTRLQLVENAEGAALADVIEVGDRVRVLDADQVSTNLTVTAIDADGLVGTTSDGATVRFALDEVREVRERRRAPGLTAALVGLSVGGFLTTVLDDIALFPQ